MSFTVEDIRQIIRNLEEDGIIESPIPAMMCEHANEVPMTCPCPDRCYCKLHTCLEEQLLKIRRKNKRK